MFLIHSEQRRIMLCLLCGLLGLLATLPALAEEALNSNSATSAVAGSTVEYQNISSAGPLTNIYIGEDAAVQIAYEGDTSYQFYPSWSIPGDSGTFVVVNQTLYAPDFRNHGGTAAGFGTPFTSVSQTAVSGSGTAVDPYRVVTVVDVGSTGLRLTHTDSYVVGEESYRTDIEISNSSDGTQDMILYRAGDCYLGGSDSGYGFVDASGAVACSKNANNSPPGRVQQYLPLTEGSTYYQAGWSSVWRWIQNKQPFPNTCRCNDRIDNGAGISWEVTVPAAGQLTLSHLTTFSPVGNLPLTMDKSADSETSLAGETNGYTIVINNPNIASVRLDSLTDELPAGFSYLPGSSTGATTADPTVSGQTLTWTGPINVPANGSISLHFEVTVTSIAGTYFNQASGVADGFTVAPTGETAPITVEGITFQPGPGGVASTNGTSSLVLWLKADAGITESEGEISAWADQSGYGNDAVIGSTGDKPTLQQNALNAQPVVRFETSSDEFTIADHDSYKSEQVHLYLVAKSTGANSSQGTNIIGYPHNNAGDSPFYRWLFWHDGNGALDQINLRIDTDVQNTTLNDQWGSHTIYGYETSQRDVYRNGGLFYDGTGRTVTYPNATALQIGHLGRFEGDIAEIILFSESLSEAERTHLELYLMDKYNIDLSGTGLYGSSTHTLNVRGISQSSQVISSGSSAGLTIDQINFLNESDDLLVFGHNAASNSKVTSDLPDGVGSRWERVWYLDKNDVDSNGGQVQLTFDISQAGFDNWSSESIALLKRAGTSGNFSVVSTVAPSDEQAIFSVESSNDLSDGYYTVGALCTSTSLGSRIWFDNDGDGVDDGEDGISGVVVNLIGAGDDQVLGTADDVAYLPQTTDENGQYQFSDLPVGLYQVDVDENSLPEGYALTTGNEPMVVTVSGCGSDQANFGYAPSLCERSVMYGAFDAGNRDTQFFTLDLGTQIASPLGAIHEDHDIEAIEIHPTDGTLYALAGNGGDQDGNLFTINKEDGSLTLIGNASTSDGSKEEIVSAAFGPDGSLWAFEQFIGLLTVDLESGNGTLVWEAAVGSNWEGLAWSPDGDYLYASEGRNLIRWDPVEQSAEQLCGDDFLPYETEALDFRFDGKLMGGSDKTDQSSLAIFEIDLNSCQILSTDYDISYNDVESLSSEECVVGGMMEGQVVNNQSTRQAGGISSPMVGLEVRLEVDMNGDGVPGFSTTTTTDDKGNYNFVNLPHGTYRVSVEGSTDSSEWVDLNSDNVSQNVDLGFTGYKIFLPLTQQ